MRNQKYNRNQQQDIAKHANYYKLKTKAVEDLVTADETNSPEVSEEELRAYRSRSGIRVADWVKLAFIKAWFAGAVCFFFIWGLGGYLADQLDLLVVTGIALGVVTEMLTNNVLRFIEKTPGANDRWMMFPQKGYITFPLNILYAFVVLALVYALYNIINLVIITVTGAKDIVPLGVEPVLFGLFYLGFDMLLIRAKYLFLQMIGDARKKVDSVRHKE